MNKVVPASLWVPVFVAMLIGAALMFFRARYVESCWLAALNLFHRHCVVAYMMSSRSGLPAYIYVATVFVLIASLALADNRRKLR